MDQASQCPALKAPTPLRFHHRCCVVVSRPPALLLSQYAETHTAPRSQLNLIFKTCGAPTPDVWPTFDRLPGAGSFVRDRPEFRNRLREIFARQSEATRDLIGRLLALDPMRRRAAVAGERGRKRGIASTLLRFCFACGLRRRLCPEEALLTVSGPPIVSLCLVFCRISAKDALTHDFFFTAPRACEPGTPESWPAVTEASHEFQTKKRKTESKAAAAEKKQQQGTPTGAGAGGAASAAAAAAAAAMQGLHPKPAGAAAPALQAAQAGRAPAAAAAAGGAYRGAPTGQQTPHTPHHLALLCARLDKIVL